MIFCQIENGVVVNRAVFAGALPADWEDRDSWIADETAQIGWTYDGQNFHEPAAPTAVITSQAVDAERDRRIAGTFTFNGALYQLDDRSQLKMTAAGADARFAIAGGAAIGNLRWADPDNDFGWIATNNTVTPMDAQTMVAFSDAAKIWVTQHIFAARALKNIDPIPADFVDDGYWPS